MRIVVPLNIHDRMSDRMEPLCAHLPVIPGFIGVYPSSIQSFRTIQRGDRSNNAHPVSNNWHTLENLEAQGGLFFVINLKLEPRASLRDTGVTGRADDVTPAMVGGRLVYPGCSRRAYIPGCIPPYIPRWCIPGIPYHTQVVYTGIPYHTQGVP